MIEQIERIKELSGTEKKNIVELGLKLSEELGELSEAILSTEDVPGCGYKCGRYNDYCNNKISEEEYVMYVEECMS